MHNAVNVSVVNLMHYSWNFKVNSSVGLQTGPYRLLGTSDIKLQYWLL